MTHNAIQARARCSSGLATHCKETNTDVTVPAPEIFAQPSREALLCNQTQAGIIYNLSHEEWWCPKPCCRNRVWILLFKFWQATRFSLASFFHLSFAVSCCGWCMWRAPEVRISQVILIWNSPKALCTWSFASRLPWNDSSTSLPAHALHGGDANTHARDARGWWGCTHASHGDTPACGSSCRSQPVGSTAASLYQPASHAHGPADDPSSHEHFPAAAAGAAETAKAS